MTIEFNCAGCQYPFKVPDTMAGKKGKCPKCGAISAIPTASTASPIAAAPPPRAKAAAKSADPDDRGDDLDHLDDEPSPRRKKRKSGSKMGLIIGLSVGGVLLLGGIGVAIFMMVGGGLGDDMKFLPADAQMIASIKVAELLNSSAWKDSKQEMEGKFSLKEVEQTLGITLDKVDRVTMAGPMKDGPDQGILVVKTKKDVKAADIKSALNNNSYKETKAGKYSMQENESDFGKSFCVVDGKTVVAGPTKILKTVLERDKTPDFSAPMKAALGKADFSKTVAFAFNIKDAIPPGMLDKPMMPGLNLDAVKSIEGVGGYIKVTSDVNVNLVVICKDSKGAEEAKKLADALITIGKGFMGADKDAAEALNAIKLSQSGSSVTVSMNMKAKSMTKLR